MKTILWALYWNRFAYGLMALTALATSAALLVFAPNVSETTLAIGVLLGVLECAFDVYAAKRIAPIYWLPIITMAQIASWTIIVQAREIYGLSWTFVVPALIAFGVSMLLSRELRKLIVWWSKSDKDWMP